MKSRNKRRQKRGAAGKHEAKKAEPTPPAPAIDTILTFSKEEGKPKLELKKEDVALLRSDIGADAKPEEPKKAGFRLPKKPESIIQTRKPKAEILKESVPEKKTVSKGGISTPKPVSSASEPKKTKEKDEGKRPEPRHIPAPSASSLGESKLALAEAALFLSPKPLMLDELAKIMGVNSLGYVKETLERLAKDYGDSGIEVVSSPAGWEMQVRPQYLSSVAHLAPYADLSEGPKRALALILFKEPLKQSDLIKMQGNKVYDYLKTLEKLGMIRREPSGRTKLLTLTKEFERYFGEEKETIRERLAQEIASQPQHAAVQPIVKKKIDAKAELNKMGIELEES